MDLSPYDPEDARGDDKAHGPIRVVLDRQGDRTTFDPSVDSLAIRDMAVERGDSIIVMDLRLHPQKMVLGRQRVNRMLKSGSTGIGSELIAVATLRHEYEFWLSDEVDRDNRSFADALEREAAQLVKEGKGREALGLLELQLDTLRLEGLGPRHPSIRSAVGLVELFRELLDR